MQLKNIVRLHKKKWEKVKMFKLKFTKNNF